MGHRPALRLVRIGVAAAFWIGAALIVQATAGMDIEGAAQRLEERIELQLKERRCPSIECPSIEPRSPERKREEPIAPWELVSV